MTEVLLYNFIGILLIWITYLHFGKIFPIESEIRKLKEGEK